MRGREIRFIRWWKTLLKGCDSCDFFKLQSRSFTSTLFIVINNMNYFSLVFEFGDFIWWKRLCLWKNAGVPNGRDKGRRKSKSCVLSAAGDPPVQSSLKPVYRKTSECSCFAAGNFQVTASVTVFIPSPFWCLWLW